MRDELTELQKQEMAGDPIFENAVINDEYVKKLKEKQSETIYVEQQPDRLLFTNSCWEIQRVNPLQGGNIILDEVIRIRHVGTGKFLAISDDKMELELKNTSNNMSCLFVLRSDMAQKKEQKYTKQKPEPEDDEDDDQFEMVKSNQRVLVMSYMEEKYLQLLDDIEPDAMAQFTQ